MEHICNFSPVQICHMFNFYRLRAATSESGFSNISEIAGERDRLLELHFEVAFTPNQPRLLSRCHFSSISQPGCTVIVRRCQCQLYKFSTTDFSQIFMVGGQLMNGADALTHTSLRFQGLITANTVNTLLKWLRLLVFCKSLTRRLVYY